MTSQFDILTFMNANNLSYRCIWYFVRPNKKNEPKKYCVLEKNDISLEEATRTRWRNKSKPVIDDIRTYTTSSIVKSITDEEHKNLCPTYSIYLKHTEKLYVVDVDVYGINSMNDFIEQTGITMFANTAWTTGNTKGIHMLIYINNMIEYSQQEEVFKAFKGDLLRTNNLWEKRNGVVNNSTIETFEWSDIESLCLVDRMTGNKKETKKKVIVEADTDVESVATDGTAESSITNKKMGDIEYALMVCIKDNMAKDGQFTEWRNVGQAIRNEYKNDEEGSMLFEEWSCKWDEDKQTISHKKHVRDFYKNLKYENKNCDNRLTIKSIMFWAKQYNSDAYFARFGKQSEQQKKEKAKLPTDDEARQTDVYIEYRKKFEKKYFKLNNPVCYCVINNHKKKGKSLTFLNEKDFNLLNKDVKGMPEFLVDGGIAGYEKKFHELWIEDPDKLKHNTIKFDPSMKEDEKHEDDDEDNYYTDYNAFVGWINDKDSEPIKEEESDFIKLMKWLLVEDRTFEYFKCWFAHIIQQPTNKTKVAPVLFSKTHGSGKNSLIDGLIAILGRGLCGHVESIDDITKNFNAHLCNKLLVYGDEINAAAKRVADKLKAYITRPTANLEKKGLDSIEVDDYTNSIFTTNHENTIKIEEGCRRFLMVRCREEKQTELSVKSYAEIEDPIKVGKLFAFFKNYKQSENSIKLYGKFVLGQGDVIETDYKKQMLFENRPAYIQMFYKASRELAGCLYSASALYEVVKEWGKKNYCSTNFTIQEFSKQSKKYIHIYKTRTNTCVKYKFPSKLEFLKNLYKVDEEYYRYINQIDDDFKPTFQPEPEVSTY